MEEKITAWVARDELDSKIVLHLHKPINVKESRHVAQFERAESA